MAVIEEAIYTTLAGAAGLTALTSTRIYPITAPIDPDLPCVVYQRNVSERVHAMGADSGLTNAAFIVNSFDDEYSGVKAVAEQVRAALQDLSAVVDSIHIQRIFLENEFDLFEPDSKTFQVSQIYEIWFTEA